MEPRANPVEGYLVWRDSAGNWHTHHSYVLSNFDVRQLLMDDFAAQAWQIPLPKSTPHRFDHFKRQLFVNNFRSRALTVAKQDFRKNRLGEAKNCV